MRKSNLIISNEASSSSARQRLVDVNVKLAARPVKAALTTQSSTPHEETRTSAAAGGASTFEAAFRSVAK